MKIKDTRKLCDCFESLECGEIFSISEDGKFYIKTENILESVKEVNTVCLNDGKASWCKDHLLVYPVKCELVIE